jgi:cobalt-zinc-cadmium resistance protein CzcA
MINRIIIFSIRNKFIILLFVLALTGWGIYSLTKLPVDAIPDITNNQVQVISLAPSLAVQEVESFITAPIEVSVANIPDITELRSISRLGLSVVTIVFKDNVDIYWARQQLSERLKEAEEVIPNGLAQISLAPISSGLGEIFQYRLTVQKGYEKIYTPMELRTLQDWVVRREMLGTPGVADINSYGGFVKEYEIAVNPDRLRSMNLTLSDIFTALEKNNENTGSAYIDKNPTAFFIRGIGIVRSFDDIENIVIKNDRSGIPVLIRDIAEVRYGNAIRYGAFVVDTAEAVGGVVMMLKGANAHEVIDNVESRIMAIQKSLPREVRIEPYLNRSDLVGRAINTVSRNLIEGALIVIFILVILLGNIRAGLIVASVIPLSMLFAVSMMNLFGVSGNLMSLGAIDFGLVVDGAVIIVESVVHRITSVKNHHQGVETLSSAQMDENVQHSAMRMMNSATFGQIIILIVYLPIMALVGIEGKMFRPMAQVVSFAILGAAILSLTYVPTASALFLSRKTSYKSDFSDLLMRWLRGIFNPAIDFALRRKALVSVSAVMIFIASLFLFNHLGGEFIPQLEEGDLAAGVMTLQGGSITNTIDKVIMANRILLANFPEIKHAVCKIGAGEIPTDPTPMETGDYIITLKDKSEWTSAKTREELVTKMEEKLVALAGVKFEFQQPIQMRFNELMTGSKQDIAIKLFGDNLNTLAEKAAEIEKLIQSVPGVEDINVEKVTGLEQIQVEYDRDKLAQYGISVSDINNILRTAFAGSQAGVVYNEEQRFGLVVRLDKDYRKNIDDINNLAVALPGGPQIPLYQIADISVRSGPAQVSREDTRRRITIGFNVRDRDVKSVINDVSHLIDRSIIFPTGYYVTYGGQFKNLEAAQRRLSVAVPVALVLIFILLYFAFNSVKQSLLIFTAVPMSAIGGILALWIRGMNFSISAGVGFIALFGVAVLNGIVLIAEFNRLEKDGIEDIIQRVKKGLQTRLRPVIMTASVASLGFLPMALSTSAGAEVQKPLATVVIGGLITATILTLIVLPVFYVFFSSGNMKINLRKRRILKITLMFIILGLTSVCNVALAQQEKVFSLHDAIQTALDSNLAIKSAGLSLDVSEALRGTAIDLPKTSIDGQFGQFNSYRNDNSFSVSQSFEFPSVYFNKARLLNANIDGRKLQYQISRLDIATQVKQIYWQYIYLRSRQSLLMYKDSLFSKILRGSELMAKSGETNKLEMISARSQRLEVGNQLYEVRSDLGINRQKLKVLLNISYLPVPSDTILQRIDDSFISDSMSFERNPILGYMLNQVEVKKIEKKIERNQALPGLNLGYFSQTILGTQEIGGSTRDFGPGYRFTGFQAGISVPLWFPSFTARSKAAGINESLARTDAEFFRKSLYGNYRSMVDEYRKYSSTVNYYETQAIPEAELIIKQATLSYRAGALDYLDFAIMINRAIAIKMDYLEAMNNLNQAIISIEYVYGKIF